MASFLLALAAIAPVLVAGNGLRGSPDTYVDSVQCTGSGALPERPMCFSGSVLVAPWPMKEKVDFKGLFFGGWHYSNSA